MRDPEYLDVLFEWICCQFSELYSSVYANDVALRKYVFARKKLIDLMVEIELGNTPDWDQITGILPTLEG